MVRRDSFRFDGIRVPVEIHGDGAPLVFLPGLGVHPFYYREGLERLSGHLTVFVPDLSFRTHADLPEQVARYRSLAEDLADRYAPDAFRAGHSFGGFLALLGSVPAIALSPLVPVAIGWRRKVGRAIRLQAREYLGMEGSRGAGWAWSILKDYLRTAVRRPASLFPAVSETLHCIAHTFRPTAPKAHVVLAEYDRLYLRGEYESFLEGSGSEALVVRRVSTGHGWPVTHPDLLEREVVRAVQNSGSVPNRR
jgi:hypothetical protein